LNRLLEKKLKTSTVVIVLCTSIIVIALVWVEFPRWYEKNSYPMAPSSFMAQTELVKVGMTKEEVLGVIRNFKDPRDEESRLILFLWPIRTSTLIETHPYYINVEFDAEGKATRATSGPK